MVYHGSASGLSTTANWTAENGQADEGSAFVYHGSGAACTTQTTTIHYTYDPLQRLTGASYSGATTYTFAYAYDAVGDRTIQTQTITSTLVTTYTYDDANRLTSVNDYDGATWTNLSGRDELLRRSM